MNFSHTEERQMLADMAGRFVREQYPIETRHEIGASDDGYSKEMWAQMAELGLVGALFPESAGGFGGSGFDIAVVFEELGRGLVVEPFLPNLLAGSVLDDAHSELIENVIGELRYWPSPMENPPAATHSAMWKRRQRNPATAGF